MGALKLFISHSSRLDDVPHRYTGNDANWRLLRETCDGLNARYDKAIRILVDREGLIPGDDWNRELNLWLLEYQAAIILVSKRALNRSDWVAKEAAILGWRRALDPNFLLIPVTIEGESTEADLGKGFFGSLDMGRIQCVNAAREAIVDGIAQRLGDAEALADRCAITPLAQITKGIAKMLAETATASSLEDAMSKLHVYGDDVLDASLTRHERCAELLARRLLQTSAHDVSECFKTFRTVLKCSMPPLRRESASWLLKQVRALWVHPSAANFLPAALDEKYAVALCAQFLNLQDPTTGSEAYTLERYLERAGSWESSPRIVNLARKDTAKEDIRANIVAKALSPHADPRSEVVKRALNRETIVLLVPTSKDSGGAPDPRDLEAFTGLMQDYEKLILVFSCCEPADSLPEGLRSVEPPLDRVLEEEAYLAECTAVRDLLAFYGPFYGRDR